MFILCLDAARNDPWHANFSEPEDGKQVIAYIDGASEKIRGKRKFDNATTDNILLVWDKAIKKFGISKQVMAEHSTHFCADEEKIYRLREELRKR